MARTVLVTGSSGRLGSALVRALAGDWDVVQLDHREPSEEMREVGRFVVGSVNDTDRVRYAMEGVEAVVHCAAVPGALEPFYRLMETNVLGTFAVLEAAGRAESVERFVFVSSLQWHGLQEKYGGLRPPNFLPITEEHPSFATGYYDTSKVMGEELCAGYVARFRKPCVALRPAWMIGVDGESEFRARPAVDGAHLNDYVGTSDVVAAVGLALDYGPPEGFDAFLLHADDQRSSTPSGEIVARYFEGVKADSAKLAACDGFGALVDCARAKDKLGWSPQFRCQR